jgi:glycosyltransferase involved in cell wall biosynthesis
MRRVVLLHTNREYATSLAEALRAEGIPFDPNVVSRVPVRERVAGLLAGDGAIVQTDELMVNGVVAAGTGLLRRTPYVVCIRGWADYTNAHGEYGRLRMASISARARAVLRGAAHVVFLSEHTRKKFCERYSVGSSSVVGRPIDVDHYGSGAPRRTETTDLLTVTNLRYEAKYRGVIAILEAIEPLFDRFEDLHYRIAGDGAYLDDLRSYLRTYPHADRVHPLGYCDDVESVLASGDVFVYVSFLDAYPTVVLEAQAAGLPVIGGDAVGVPAVVGDAGIVCRPTFESLRGEIERVLADPELRRSLAAASREKMETHNADCARGHAAVWTRVLDGVAEE